MSDTDLYEEGEEKFGPITSCAYGLFATPILSKYYRVIKDDIANKDFRKILDIGCGPGKLIIFLAENMKNSQFYGLDPSPSMIKIASKNIQRKKIGDRVNLAMGSSREIPFKEKFDLILSSFSYHHWKDRDNSLINLMNYLNNNGAIFIYEYDNNLGRLKNSHGVREEEWEELEVKGAEKIIEHKNGLIILRIVKK